MTAVASAQEALSVDLFLTEGSSNKQYHLELQQNDDSSWCAFYANGPRGALGKLKPIKAGSFTYEEALTLYNGKLKSKTKDGYTPDVSGRRYAGTERADLASGHSPQLLRAITRDEAVQMLTSDEFAMQEKANGERCAVEVVAGVARGINKLGLYRPLPDHVARAAEALGDAFLDGELVKEKTLHIFDLLSFKGQDLRKETFETRYTILSTEAFDHLLIPRDAPLQVLHASFTIDGKLEKLERVEEDGGEGVVYKMTKAPYESGRSACAFKFKFVDSVTCIVKNHNDGRSVGIHLLAEDGSLVDVGNVTIPSSFDMPTIGELVEVQHLYFNPGGAFEQPVYLGPRTDVLREECTLSQITRLKPGIAMDGMGNLVAAQEPARERMRG